MATFFAAFVIPKKKNRAIDPPCLDPMSYGVGDEPVPELLARRGRITLFSTYEEASEAIRKTAQACKGDPWIKKFAFVVLECHKSGE